LNAATANFGQQLRLGLEVLVDERLGHLDRVGHLLQRCARVTLVIEQVHGRRHDALALEPHHRVADVLRCIRP
jgi:hypothetical protein